MILCRQFIIVSLSDFMTLFALNNTKGRIFGLDLIRGIGMIWIMFTHCLWVNPDMNESLASFFRLGGTLGMEAFFVLSGFLIGRILIKEYLKPDFSGKNMLYFWVRRWFRTLPNYYLFLGINLIVFNIYYSGIPENLVKFLYFGDNITGEHPTFYMESWCLSIEEYSYLLGPLIFLILFLSNKNGNRMKNLWGGTIAIIIFFFITKCYYNTTVSGSTLEFWNTHLKPIVLYRIDAVYYGVLGAIISVQYAEKWTKYKVKLIQFSGVSLFVFFYILPYLGVRIEYFPFFYNVLYFPLLSVLILCAVPFLSEYDSISRKSPFYKVITFMSVISYNAYLVHYSIVLFILKSFFYEEDNTFLEAVLLTSAYFVISIFLAAVLHKYYETPMMNIRDKKWIKDFLHIK